MPDPLELLWIDPKSAARIKKSPAWQAHIEAAEEDSKSGRIALPGDEISTTDRFDVAAVLARGSATYAAGVRATLAGAMQADGKLDPPLVLVEGELWLPLDDLATLEATVSTAAPYIGSDAALRTAIEAAKELLAVPDPIAGPAVVEGLIAQIREAFGRTNGGGPTGYLEVNTERALLEQRRYQRRGSRIRALLQSPSDTPMLVYLPFGGSLLPLASRFRARLIAEAHLAVDRDEVHPFALEARALARVLPKG